MIVLNVAKKLDITNVSFLNATQLLVRSHSVWDVTTAQRAPVQPISGFLVGVFGNIRSGEWCLGSTHKGELTAYNPAMKRTVVEPVEGRTGRIVLTLDGKTVIFRWYTGNLPIQNGYASRTFSETGTFGPGFRVLATSADDTDFYYYFCGLDVLPDGERFVTIDWSISQLPQLAIRAVSTGKALASVRIAGRASPILAIAPDGEQLATTNLGCLCLLPTSDLTQWRATKNDGRKHFTDLAFHPSGRFIATTSNDTTVKLYDTTTLEVARTFTWDIGRMRSIAFSPDGTLAAAGSDKGKVVVWDVDL